MERRDAEMAEMPRLSVPPHVTWHPTFLHFSIWIVLFATCKATLSVTETTRDADIGSTLYLRRLVTSYHRGCKPPGKNRSRLAVSGMDPFREL